MRVQTLVSLQKLAVLATDGDGALLDGGLQWCALQEDVARVLGVRRAQQASVTEALARVRPVDVADPAALSGLVERLTRAADVEAGLVLGLRIAVSSLVREAAVRRKMQRTVLRACIDRDSAHRV